MNVAKFAGLLWGSVGWKGHLEHQNIVKLYRKFKNIVKFSVLYCSGDLLVGKDIYIAVEYLEYCQAKKFKNLVKFTVLLWGSVGWEEYLESLGYCQAL